MIPLDKSLTVIFAFDKVSAGAVESHSPPEERLEHHLLPDCSVNESCFGVGGLPECSSLLYSMMMDENEPNIEVSSIHVWTL
jgi:hypothetical protein